MAFLHSDIPLTEILSDASVICIDSDSSDSIIYIRSCNSVPGHQDCNSNNFDHAQSTHETYSSSEEEMEFIETDIDMDGFEIIKRLYAAMESFVHLPDRERHGKFWNSRVLQDIKSLLYKQDYKLRKFIKDIMKPDTIIFDQIPKRLFNFIRQQSNFYCLNVQSRGSNQEEYLLIIRQSNTYIPNRWRNHLDIQIFEYVNNFWREYLGKKSQSIEFDPISCVGYQMLVKMGWQPGTPLGIGEGILEPIQLLNSRFSKSGLGIEDYF